MAERQLGFEFAQRQRPNAARVELAAARARAHAAHTAHTAQKATATHEHRGEPEPALERSTPPQSCGRVRHVEPPQAPEPPSLTNADVAVNDSETAAQTAREALTKALELALRARVQSPLRLTITDNRRTMVSLRKHKKTQLVEARIHHMFLHAEAEVWRALGDYLFSGEREAATCIARYIEQHRKQIRRPARRPLALATAGQYHDLSAISRSVDERYFEGKLQLHITWARENPAPPRAGRRSIKLGSYTSRDRLIRVHPALDAEFVPRYFVEYIVYHEMLHHVLPPKRQNGRRELHGPSFVARERQFHDYEAALRWERQNLNTLLRHRPQRKADS